MCAGNQPNRGILYSNFTARSRAVLRANREDWMCGLNHQQEFSVGGRRT